MITTPTTPTTPAAPAPAPLQKGSPEYIHEMSWRADNADAFARGEKAPAYVAPNAEQKSTLAPKSADVPAMPEGGQTKFFNAKTGAYDWASHAKEAEWKLSQKGDKKTGAKPADAPAKSPEVPAKSDAASDAAAPEGDKKSDDATDADADVKDVVEKAGLDFDTLSAKVLDKSALDDSDYEALEANGIPRHVVDSHIEGVKAQRELNRMKSNERAGGKEQLDAALKWAEGALSEAEKAEVNGMLGGRQFLSGVDALMKRYQDSRKSAGEPGTTIGGDNIPGQSGGPAFRSQAEYLEAMGKRNERGQKLYEVDEAYRHDVRQRLLAMK